MRQFAISDLHVGHYNIIKYCNRPFSGTREMEDVLVGNWNAAVSQSDIVYFLGDFAFRHKLDELKRIFSRLNGYIYLIRGNHDNLSAAKYLDIGFADVKKDHTINYFGKSVFMEHVPNRNNALKYDVYLHGHTHDRDPDWDTPNRVNVSVEKINYTPIDLDDVLSHIERKRLYNRTYER